MTNVTTVFSKYVPVELNGSSRDTHTLLIVFSMFSDSSSVSHIF